MGRSKANAGRVSPHCGQWHAWSGRLTPTAPPVEFGWKTIEAGPAAGANVMVPLNTPIADAITTGSYDQKVLQVVEALVSKTDTCFDIG